jgi:hypothetical protein
LNLERREKKILFPLSFIRNKKKSHEVDNMKVFVVARKMSVYMLYYLDLNAN